MKTPLFTKIVEFALFVAAAFSAANAMAGGQPLMNNEAQLIHRISESCVAVTKVYNSMDRVHVSMAQIRPNCQSWIQFDEASGRGQLNLGYETFDFQVSYSQGMDADESRIVFLQKGTPVASYEITDDSIENGLAVLKTLF